jgi:ribonuclease BN (tRNA processing enzyme)
VRFSSLGSGSEGNSLLIEAEDATRGRPRRVMLDCGFGLREAERRLARLGCEPASLDGILVTHEHGDHVGGVFRLARAHGIFSAAAREVVEAAGLPVRGPASSAGAAGDCRIGSFPRLANLSAIRQCVSFINQPRNEPRSGSVSKSLIVSATRLNTSCATSSASSCDSPERRARP